MFRLHASCLASKWGFNDGDVPEEFIDKVDEFIWRDHTLPTVVEKYLLPLIPDVETFQMDTCHNPIRAENPEDVFDSDVFVDVTLEQVLEAQALIDTPA